MISDKELKTEVLQALDAVTPAAPWLRATVHTKVRQLSKSRRTERPRFRGIRQASAFAAILAAVLLVATLLVGGQIWQDLQRFQTVQPEPGGKIVAELRARPIVLPTLTLDAECPVTPKSTITYGTLPYSVYGSGPVYGLAGWATSTRWGTYYDVKYLSDPNFKGIVLIRIRDLKSDRHGVFVGPYAAGKVVGTDTIDSKLVQQHEELILDASQPGTASQKWGSWTIQQGLAAGWSQCFGIQIDGPDFTEVITGDNS